jgi:phage shock protein C
MSSGIPGPQRPIPEGSDPSAVPPPPAEPARPVLRRSKTDRVLFGVSGGLGRYLGIDPIIIRIAFVLLVFFGGSGLLLYLIGLVVIPEERPGEHVGHGTATGFAGNAAAVIGVVLVLVGTFSLLRQVLPGLGQLMGPMLLILLGALVILAGRR